MRKNVEEQLELISRGVHEIFPLDELKAKLARSISTGKPLRVKLGVDPSTSDLHLGHTVVLRKLRHFQELGHKAVLIIGDGTGLVGDPSGRDSTRPQLTPDQIDQNARTYIEQASCVLEVSDPLQFEMRRNGDWFRKMDFFEVVRLASRMTVARLLERDDFSKRFGDQTPIYLHELLYPAMQGWDSVVVEADIELGGTDQKYNLLVGRDFQRAQGQEPQVCLTMPLLVGTDGTQKMSKSYGNHIGITEPAKTMFDKTLSIPDSLMRDYFILLTDVPTSEIDEMLRDDSDVIIKNVSFPDHIESTLNLRNNSLHGVLAAKVKLAYIILAKFNSPKVAGVFLGLYLMERERKAENTKAINKAMAIAKKEALASLDADAVQKVVISSSDLKDGKVWIVKLVRATGFVKSNSEARRKITEGAVTVNDKRITDPDAEVCVQKGDIVKLGKKRLAVVTLREG